MSMTHLHHRAIPKPGNSLAERAPDIASELNPGLNDGLTADLVCFGSGKRLNWQCRDCGHVWPARVSHRTSYRRTGCPECSQPWISLEEIRLRNELIAAGVPVSNTVSIAGVRCDIVVEEWRVAIEFDGNYYHRADKIRDKDERNTATLTQAGYKVIRVREGLDQVGPSDVIVPLYSDEVVRAKAVLLALQEIGFEARLHAAYMDAQAPWGPDAGRLRGKRPPEHRSLAVRCPEIAAEWNHELNAPLTPRDVTFKSSRSVHWKCPKGHRFQSRVFYRTDRMAYGCKECAVDARRLKLSADEKQRIRDEYATGAWTQKQLAKRYSISNGSVWNILRAIA